MAAVRAAKNSYREDKASESMAGESTGGRTFGPKNKPKNNPKKGGRGWNDSVKAHERFSGHLWRFHNSEYPIVRDKGGYQPKQRGTGKQRKTRKDKGKKRGNQYQFKEASN